MKAIEKFKTLIGPFCDGWKSIEIRSVCFEVQERLVSLGTRVILSHKQSEDVQLENSLPDFPRFKAFHKAYDAKILNDILEQLEKGVFKIDNQNIFFKIENNEVKASPLSFYLEKTFSPNSIALPNFKFPTITLRDFVGSFHSLLANGIEPIDREYLDQQLCSAEIPYNGLSDLYVNFLGFQKPEFGNVDSAIVEIVAPLLLKLGDGCKMSNGRITLEVEVVGYENLDGVLVGVIEHSGEVTHRRKSYSLSEADWKEQNGIRIANKEIPAENTTSADIFLTFRNKLVDSIVVRDPGALLKNPKIFAYNHFDKDLKALKDYLGLAGKNPANFEVGIGILLHFCGFNIGQYCLVSGKKGVASIHDEIDIVAFGPSNYVLALECTEKDIDINGKISKFSRKVKEIKRILEGYEILPFLVTHLERSHISESDMKKSVDEGIGVIAIEEIKELLETAGQYKRPNEIINYLKGLIISKEFFLKRKKL